MNLIFPVILLFSMLIFFTRTTVGINKLLYMIKSHFRFIVKETPFIFNKFSLVDKNIENGGLLTLNSRL